VVDPGKKALYLTARTGMTHGLKTSAHGLNPDHNYPIPLRAAAIEAQFP